MNTTRRDFLKVGAGVVAATSADSADSNDGFSSIASGRSAAATARDGGNMIYRRFGRTDVHISAIGVGRHHLGDAPTLDSTFVDASAASQAEPDSDWRTVALCGRIRPSLSWIAEIDFLFTTEPHETNLSGDSHLPVLEGRGTSELKLSATIFHLPSDCLTHTAMSLPRSTIGAPFGALIVIWYL